MGPYPDAAFVRRVGTSRMIYSNGGVSRVTTGSGLRRQLEAVFREGRCDIVHVHGGDRKSTRLNSSHSQISYAVFCLKKKKKKNSKTTHKTHPDRTMSRVIG